MFVVLWEFIVRREARDAFVAAYGAEGDWARLFRRCPGYLGTELLRDHDADIRYMTVDRWTSPESFAEGLASLGDDYRALDRRCETLTTAERRLGQYVSA